jgi:hypothetical protein
LDPRRTPSDASAPGIIVGDLHTVTAFFAGPGLETEGRTVLEGEFLDTDIRISAALVAAGHHLGTSRMVAAQHPAVTKRERDLRARTPMVPETCYRARTADIACQAVGSADY